MILNELPGTVVLTRSRAMLDASDERGQEVTMRDVSRFRRRSVSLVTLGTMLFPTLVQAAQVDLITPSDSAEPSPSRIRAVLRFDLVYAAHGNGDFTGSDTILFNNAVLLNLPKLAPGFGYSIGAGALFARIPAGFNLIATINYGRTSHSSQMTYSRALTSYPNAHLSLLELELDLMHDNRFIKPFIGVSSGLAWLDLPGTRIDVDTTQQAATYGLDASLRGYAIRPKIGAMVEAFRGAMVNLDFGYRFYIYKYSSIAPLAPYSFVARGVTLCVGMKFVWPN